MPRTLPADPDGAFAHGHAGAEHGAAASGAFGSAGERKMICGNSVLLYIQLLQICKLQSVCSFNEHTSIDPPSAAGRLVLHREMLHSRLPDSTLQAALVLLILDNASYNP